MSMVGAAAVKKATPAGGAVRVEFGGFHMFQLKFKFYSITSIKILKIFDMRASPLTSARERYAFKAPTGFFRFARMTEIVLLRFT